MNLYLKNSTLINNMDKVCFIITGLITEMYIKNLILVYKNINNKIISTWKDQDKNLLKILEENNFHICLNDPPQIMNQVNVQAVTIKAAAEKAAELGFTHVIRMRTDLITNDPVLLLNSIYTKLQNKLCSLGWVADQHGYIIDYIFAGPVKNIIQLFESLKSNDDNRFTEKFIQEEYFKKYGLSDNNSVTYELVKTHFNFIYMELYNNNVTLTWIKTQYAHQYNDSGEIIHEFHKYLSDNYMWKLLL